MPFTRDEQKTIAEQVKKLGDTVAQLERAKPGDEAIKQARIELNVCSTNIESILNSVMNKATTKEVPAPISPQSGLR